MKETKMKLFTIYYNEGEERNKSVKIVTINFETALKAKFGNYIPDIINVYSDDVVAYVGE